MNCKTTALGAVFLMVAVAFVGISLVSEESDAELMSGDIFGYAVKKGESVEVAGIYETSQFEYGEYTFDSPDGITVQEIENSRYVEVTASDTMATGSYEIVIKRDVNGTERSVSHTIWVNDYASIAIGYYYTGDVEDSISESINLAADGSILQGEPNFGGSLPAGVSCSFDTNGLYFSGTPASPGLYVYVITGMIITNGNVRLANMGVLFEITTNYDTYTITYDSNGGSSVPDTVVTGDSRYMDVTLASAPTRLGYTFAGWKVGNTVYAAGDTVSVRANDSVTAVAQWTYNVEKKLTVTNPGTQYVVSGKTVSFTASSSANTGNPSVTYSVSSVPDGLTVTVSGNTVTVKCPTVSVAKDYTFVLTASASGYVSSDITVTVHAVPVLAFTNTPSAGVLGA